MSGFQMPDRDSKPQFVQENFNVIAKKYDQFNDWNSFFLHRHWKNRLVQFAKREIPEARSILDLCSGTGDIAFRLRKAFPELETLYAVDFSENMLSYCRSRLAGDSRSRVQLGDATQLKDFPNSSLDIVTIGFGLRNVGDLEKCLHEIHRVLRPGGIFLNLDVGKVRNPIIRFFADFYFFRIVPWMGKILWGSANPMFDYLPVSSISYPDQENLKIILQKNGFSNVSYHDFVFGNATLHFAKKLPS